MFKTDKDAEQFVDLEYCSSSDAFHFVLSTFLLILEVIELYT